MAKISLDNGHTYITAQEAMPAIAERGLWDAIVSVMDDDIREAVHRDLAPFTKAEFLARYLELAPCDLIIG